MAAAFEQILEDNTVRYQLYPRLKPAAGQQVADYLQQYIDESLGKLAKYLTGYIWQKEPFNLRVAEDAPYQTPHIDGLTNFGDNVEDEWFIVYLLMKLTKDDPDLIVKLEDYDGDFLLTEAAEYLPRWADPDNTINRVFVYRSEVHLIPLRRGPLPRDTTPLIPEAIEAVRSYPHETRANEDIQASIFARIGGYPAKALEMRHNAKSFVPAAVAALLDADPSLISAAVGAFYTRDPVDMRALRAMKYFPPENRVMKVVTLTRCMYGQLMGQKYNPDHKIGWDMPSTKTSAFKPYDLGMKIACGFEILAANANPVSANSAKGLPDDGDLLNDIRWQRYLKSLEENGFFKGLMKGSRDYTKLMGDAKSFYMTSIATTADDNQVRTSQKAVGRKILDLLRNVEIDYEKLRNESLNAQEDDDKWMHVHPQEFDEILKQKFNGGLHTMGSKVPEALDSFINRNSGLKGAELPPVAPIRKNRKTAPSKSHNGVKKHPVATNGNGNSSELPTEPESFADAIRSVLTLQVPYTDSETSSGMSDYSDESDSEDSSEGKEDELDVMRNKRNKEKNRTGKEEELLVDEMKNYMDQMDRELAKTKVGESFERAARPPLATCDDDEINEEDDDYTPVDVDLNALKNMLESFNSQNGMAGPSSNLLQSMGVYLPHSKDDDSFTKRD